MSRDITEMPSTKKEGEEPSITDQWPRWKGPTENRPGHYLPTKEDPAVDRKVAGENLADTDLSDAPGSEEDFERTRRRAFAPWERVGRSDGSPDAYWRQFFAVR